MLTMVSVSLSACSNPDQSTLSAQPTVAITGPAPETQSPSPSVPVDPSLPAGIPSTEPSPLSTADPETLAASVQITLATVDPDTGGLLLGGFVSGVMEDGGTCQYVVTPANGDLFTIHKDGVENNGSTSCGSTTVPPSSAPSGDYTVVLRYVNDIGQVESDAVEVEIP